MTNGRPEWKAAMMTPQCVHAPCRNIPIKEERDTSKAYSNGNRVQVPPSWGFDLTESAHLEMLSFLSE
jgi:hypothetical protein